MQRVMNLVGKKFELGRGFKVHHSKEVTSDPGVLRDQCVSKKLVVRNGALTFTMAMRPC